MHSPLAEVAICMSIYAMVPLAIENIPPVLERLWYFDSRLRPGVERMERRLHFFFPWIIAAAYLLPGMHQSSLGALMLLAGERVHPLWQSVAAILISGRVDFHVVWVRRRNHHVVLRGVEARNGYGSS